MSDHHPSLGNAARRQPVNPIRRGLLADGWMDDEQRDVVRHGDIIVAFGIYGIGFASSSSSSSYRPCAAQSRILRMHRAQFRALSLSAIGDTRQSTDSERERAFQFRPQNGVPFSSPFSAFLKIGRISMRATRSRNLRPAPHSPKTHCKDTWGVPRTNSVAGY